MMLWSSVLFNVAQAMDHRNYSDIPAAMKQAEQKFTGIKATSEMDEDECLHYVKRRRCREVYCFASYA